MTPSRSSSTAVSKSVALVDAGAEDAQLAPEHALQVDLARGRVDGDDHERAAHLGERGGPEHGGGRAGHLEHDVGAGTAGPVLDPGDLVGLARVEGREAELVDLRAPAGLEFDRPRPRAPKCRATVAISTPIGPPPMTTTLSPGASSERRTSCTATATGSTSAACSRRETGGQAHEDVGAARSRAAAASRASRCRRSSGSGRCAGCRRGRRGRCRPSRSGMTVTGSPTAQPVDAVAERGDRAAHLVAEARAGVVDPRVHVAVEDVQVGAAEPGVGDAICTSPARRRDGPSTRRTEAGLRRPRACASSSNILGSRQSGICAS